MADMDGRIVLVTGAMRGLGQATARALAAAGAKVAVTDLTAPEDLAAEIGGVARAQDVTSEADWAATMEWVRAELGGLDVLVNNAGVSSFCPIDDDDHYELVWDRAVSVLLTAHQRMIRAALPHLRRSSSPRIVNIASTEALGATARNSPYAAAKAGVTGLTRALAVELGKEGITVNAICPGPILTGMTEKVSEADKAVYAQRRTALRRYGLPEEVAHMTLSLCLPAASFVTGVTIPVDGGLMARNA